MKKSVLGAMAVAMLLIVGLIAPATAEMVTPGGDHGACGDLEWIKFDYDDSTDVWAPERSQGLDDAIANPVISNIVHKTGESGEPIRFDWTSSTEVVSVHTKSGSNPPVSSGTSGTSGTVNTGAGAGQPAISFVVFCFGTPEPEPDPDPDPEPGPETIRIAFEKEWAGDDFEGSDDVVVTFDVEIAGATVTLDDGEASEPFDFGADWTLIGENVTGFPDDECSYTLGGGTGTLLDDVLTIPIENVVTCEETEVLPTEPIERAPEDVTPTPEDVTPTPEAEVLGETLTRTTPTRIDSGTGGSLDNSGLLALLLVGGAALSGFGITSAATARRRR